MGYCIEMAQSNWTFLTNHTHVLVCLYSDEVITLREVAKVVGITERAAHRIVADLESTGYVIKNKDGRRNRYRVHTSKPLRHPMEAHKSVGALLALLAK